MSDNVIHLMPIVPALPWNERIDWFRSLSTGALKRMWDNEEIGQEYCDEIHKVMNERGEGLYVAV